MEHLAATASTVTRPTTRLATGIICGLLVAPALVANQSAVHWRPNVVDSHLFAYHGWSVAQGARPYLDVWDNKPPGIWWLNALGFLLCGEGIGGELLICSVALLTTLTAFILAARAAYHPTLTVPAALTGSIVLTHLVYECGANRTETFVVMLESLAVLGYLRWLRCRRWPWLALGGLAAGAAPLFKQSGLAAAGAIILHLVWRQFGPARVSPQRPGWRVFLIVGVTLALPPLAVAATLAAQGALGEAWFAVGAFNQAYFTIGDASYHRIDRALRIYWQEAHALQPLAWLALMAGAGVAWAAWRRARHPVRPDSGRTHAEVFWLWLLLAGYLACIGPGRRGHHLMPVLPALCLLALYPLHRLAATGGLWARLTRQPTAAVVVVLYGYLLGQLLAGHAEQLNPCWLQKSRWYALSYAQPPGYQLQAAEIQRLAPPSEPIYVWGFSPGTYRCAYRRCSSRFATLEKLGQLGPPARFILDQAVADIRAHPPAAMAFSGRDLHAVLTDTQSEFTHWLTAHYEDRGPVGGMHILARRHDRCALGTAAGGPGLPSSLLTDPTAWPAP